MQSNPNTRRENQLLDIFKYACAVLIMASHCLPLLPNEPFNFLFGQWFFRFCVPLFLISSGYYFASFDLKRKGRYIKRIAVLYVVSTLIYLPRFAREGRGELVRNLFLGYHHLWYLSALLIALCVYLALEYCPGIQKGFGKACPYLAALLIVVGAFYDEYQYALPGLGQLPLFTGVGEGIWRIGTSRHALFFALPMLLIGKFIFDHQKGIRGHWVKWLMLAAASLGAALAECLLLRRLAGDGITCDITLLNYFPAVFLFVLTLACQPKGLEKARTKGLRKCADILYIDHVWVIVLVDSVFPLYYLPRFLLVWALSHAAAWLWLRLISAREDARALRMAVDGYAGRLAHLESRCAKLEEQIAQLSGQKDEK